MTSLVKRTARRGLIGIALTILAISGLAGSAFGQGPLSGATAQVFKSDTNRNFSDKAPVSLTVTDNVDTTASPSTDTSEKPARIPTRSRPNVALLNSVFPAGAQPKGTDLSLGVSFTNSGGQAAQVFTVINPIPAQTEFKLDSPTALLGTTGMTAEVEYSNDNASTWTYTPVSGGGGALEGYDRSVTHVRWRFNGGLSQTFPDNAGSVAITARIR